MICGWGFDKDNAEEVISNLGWYVSNEELNDVGIHVFDEYFKEEEEG